LYGQKKNRGRGKRRGNDRACCLPFTVHIARFQAAHKLACDVMSYIL